MNNYPLEPSEHSGQPPRDPQYPADLHSYPSYPPTSSPSYPSYAANPWGGGSGADGGGRFSGYGGQPPSLLVPPEFDPAVDVSKLDRKTAHYIQKEVGKWARQAGYSPTPEEGKTLAVPIRNLLFGTLGGILMGRLAVTRLMPTIAHGPKGKVWLYGSTLVGYPVGLISLHLSQTPCIQAILEKKTPLGVQARYFFRVAQAEKNGLSPPPPPLGTPPSQSPYGNQPQMQQPGASPSGWGYGQAQQPSPLQWNSFQPQPQYPPPTGSNIQQFGRSAQGEIASPEETRYRSWEDIRRASPTDSSPNHSPSASDDLSFPSSPTE